MLNGPATANEQQNHRAARPRLRIAVLTEFVRALPADNSAWAPLIAAALAARGHHVTALADGIETPDAFGALPTIVHRHGRIHHGCEPFGFRRWAARTLAKLAPDVTLSLTDHVAAQVWLPLGPGPWAFVRSLRHTTLVGAALDIAHRPYIALELFSQRAALREAARMQATIARFAADPSSTRDARVQLLPHASIVAARISGDLEDERANARRALGVHPTTPLLALSATDHEADALAIVFEALAQMRAHSTAAPRLLLASRTPSRLRRRAALHGVADTLTPIGTTHAPEFWLAAADALLAPTPARTGDSSGRLIADALALGVPVIAHALAPGAQLITGESGIRLHAAGATRWRDAILHACDPAWRQRASNAARASVPSVQAVIDALEDALNAAAQRT